MAKRAFLDCAESQPAAAEDLLQRVAVASTGKEGQQTAFRAKLLAAARVCYVA
jgi:hypothetical protein